MVRGVIPSPQKIGPKPERPLCSIKAMKVALICGRRLALILVGKFKKFPSSEGWEELRDG